MQGAASQQETGSFMSWRFLHGFGKVRKMKARTIDPEWLTARDAAKYAGVCVRTIQNYILSGAVRSTSVVIPGNTRGRRLVHRPSLDQFIEQGVGVAMKRNLPARPRAGATRPAGKGGNRHPGDGTQNEAPAAPTPTTTHSARKA